MSRALLALAAVSLLGCEKPAAKPEGGRFHLEKVGPADIRVVPSPGQLPFCLAFSASERGVVRLLTMSAKNEAFKCDAGHAIAEYPFHIPVEDGPVRIIVVFADAQIEATPIAAQVREISYKQRKVTGMDLRAPGTIAVDAIEFTPQP